MTVVPLGDLSAPDLQPFLTLRRPQIPFQQGLFVAEGPIVVERLLRSPFRVRSVLATPDRFERFRALIESRSEEIRAYVAERKVLEGVIGVPYHHGIMALGDCPPDPKLEDVLREAPSPKRIVALDGLTQAENVGVIVRSAAALGATALISGPTSCSPWLRRAVRNSMGGVFVLPILHAKDLAGTLRGLSGTHGFRIIAADPSGAKELQGYRFPPDACLVFGSEGDGHSKETRTACQDFVRLPIGRGLDSLNVAAAATAFLWEAWRAR